MNSRSCRWLVWALLITRLLVACVENHGFAPLKQAANYLRSHDVAKQTAGKSMLLALLSPEVVVHAPGI